MNEPMVKIAGVYEKISQKGTRYFVGRLGNAKLLIFANQDKKQESDPDWLLYVQDREEAPQQAHRPDGRPAPGRTGHPA